jgi:hypothetical protein
LKTSVVNASLRLTHVVRLRATDIAVAVVVRRGSRAGSSFMVSPLLS